jgi:hypothetical protein
MNPGKCIQNAYFSSDYLGIQLRRFQISKAERHCQFGLEMHGFFNVFHKGCVIPVALFRFEYRDVVAVSHMYS